MQCSAFLLDLLKMPQIDDLHNRLSHGYVNVDDEDERRFSISLKDSDLFLGKEKCIASSYKDAGCQLEMFFDYVNDKLRAIPYVFTHTAVGSIADSPPGSRVPPYYLTLACLPKINVDEQENVLLPKDMLASDAASRPRFLPVSQETLMEMAVDAVTKKQQNKGGKKHGDVKRQTKQMLRQMRNKEIRKHNKEFNKRMRDGLTQRDPVASIDWLANVLKRHECVKMVYIAEDAESVDSNVLSIVLYHMPWLESLTVDCDQTRGAWTWHWRQTTEGGAAAVAAASKRKKLIEEDAAAPPPNTPQKGHGRR